MIGPIPPDELVGRVGISSEHFPSIELRAQAFDAMGRSSYEDLIRSLPPGSLGEGSHTLDFGCGSGRVLRYLVQHGHELTACDIDEASVEWLRSAYPAVKVFRNSNQPQLPLPDEAFDLIFCGSVFSHLPDWAPWIIELRRLLKPGGRLVASIHGRGFWHIGVHGSRGVVWDEEGTGIIVEHYGSDFDKSWGPAVYVGEWWLREHWGRAFTIEKFEPSGFAIPENRSLGQALVVARKDSTETLTASELLAPSNDPREVKAAVRAQWLAYEEVGHLLTTVQRLWGDS